MITLRAEHEIEKLRAANRIVAEVLTKLAGMVAPGVKTDTLDQAAEKLIRARGAEPAFKGYRGYPKSTCISVDEVVVHGIPGRRKLAANQIVSIDVGTLLDGYYGDAAVSVACGKLDDERQRLMAATDLALGRAIAAARPGNRLEAVSRAVEETSIAAGFGVVRSFVGHGIGTRMHEDPQVPNFVTDDPGPELQAGMVLALEPMLNAGTEDVRVLKDGWTAVTKDGRPSAHFEHSIVIREGDAEVLSASPHLVWGQARD